MESRPNMHEVRRQLDHPVIDADGHWTELHPIFLDYVRQYLPGPAVDKFRQEYGGRMTRWFRTSPSERLRKHLRRPSYWGLPTNTMDRAASMIPALYRARLDEWGIDVSLVYPTMGFTLARDSANMPDVVSGLVRGYNAMAADMFSQCRDRIIPAGIVNMDEPAEAIAQLEHARSVGLKVVTIGGAVPRTIEEDKDWQPDPAKRRVYVDGLGIDSRYDYDPVWQKFVDLKVPVISHVGSIGWPDRSSPSNFVFNHLGHFAQSHHHFARALFLGGVTQRFPGLNFGFLEGGVGWACNLFSDLFGHWEKRNQSFMMDRLNPANLDTVELRRVFDQYAKGTPCFEGRIDEIFASNLDTMEPGISQQELSERSLGPELDEFSKIDIASKRDIRRLFAQNFYFGCEADDPMTAIAFDGRLRLKLKSVLGSDISHFDVADPTEVLGEAWEMIEHGLLTLEDFREFTFTNAIELYAGMDASFFDGTVVEKAARDELPRAKARKLY